MSTTFLLAGIGTVFGERAGVVNIGIEGIMLVGSLAGVIGSWMSGSVWVGMLLAMAGGLLVALLFAFFSVRLYSNQIVVGVAINILAIGLTVLIYRGIFGVNGDIPEIDTFHAVAVPLLSRIPFIGSALFDQPIPVYIAYILVPLCSFIMNRTNIGLKVRSVGNNPMACDTVGLNVSRIRFGAVAYTGIMAGFAGAFLSTGQLSAFTENMVSGRGYIVIAAVACGNYTPVGVFLSSLMFGASEALEYRLQVINQSVPTEIWAMLPYIITLIALCVYQKKSNRPACSGTNYERQG